MEDIDKLLLISCKNKDTKNSLKYLKQNPVINKKDENGCCAIEYAIKNNMLDVLNTMINKNNEKYLTCIDKNGNTLLINLINLYGNKTENWITSYFSDMKNMIIKLIRMNVINIDHTDIDGNNALMILCKNKQKDLIKLLLKYNPDINNENIFGETALSISSENSEEISLLLIDKYKKKISDKNINKIFYNASKTNKFKLMQNILNNYNIDIWWRGKNNNSALELLANNKRISPRKNAVFSSLSNHFKN